MIDFKWLVEKGFVLNIDVYEKWCAKRTFITAKDIDGEWYVGLEITGSTVGLSHIKSKEQVCDLYFALSGQQLVGS